MRYIFITFFAFSTACASANRAPATAPAGTLPLEQALQQGLPKTLEYLKPLAVGESYVTGTLRDPAANVPKSLKAERPAKPSKEKSQQQRFLKIFRAWSLNRKTAKARVLTADFDCSKALEAQALGFSLELDFPEDEATIASTALHEKVLTCATFPRHESLFRLSIFAIQKNNCPKAMEYLDMFPATPERGMIDRLAYLRGLCSGDTAVSERNPWGGYGIRLSDSKTALHSTPAWYLTATSGSEEWDRLLKTFIVLSEQDNGKAIQYISSKLNYEKFRGLPLPFQTSMLVLMSYAGADLAVFQALHRYLADHPEMAAPSVQNLLFPKRYWKEIVENTKDADPILVKALIRQESAFNPSARSRAKAAGLMQLIYPTAHRFGVTSRKQWTDPGPNIRAGSKFLGQLINEFGSVELALAAYNAGPAVVHQWQKRYPTQNIDLFVEMIPYSETREYVRLVNRNFRVYQSLMQSPELLTMKAAADSSIREPTSLQEVKVKRITLPECAQETSVKNDPLGEILCGGNL
jgi:soluble lytic murein transglycosylase-like protein